MQFGGKNMPMGWEGRNVCGLGEGGKSLTLGWAQPQLRRALRPLSEQRGYNE